MIAEWLQMGGYAQYVWPSYVLGLLILGLNLWLPIRRHRKLIKTLRNKHNDRKT